MAAPILLSDYRMKKKTENNRALKESEIGVDLKYMREFRAENIARFNAIDKRFDEMGAKIDRAMEENRAMYHKAMLILEEQNLRNKQAYDGYTFMYEEMVAIRAKVDGSKDS